MAKLEGRVAVITGGASGIGEATARLFIEEGASVVILDVDDEPGQHIAGELGPRARYLHADVTSEPDIRAGIELALEEFGRLDCMFNNAGSAGTFAPIQDIPTADFDRSIALLLRAPFLGIKHAAPIMKQQGSGSIINTASMAGMVTGDSDHSYATAKAGVIHLTRSAAMELGESGIRVNSISPGWIVTGAFQRAAGLTRDFYAGRVPTIKEHFAALQPIKRAGMPDDVAKAALWLASDDSSFVNGHNLVVDGGFANGRTWSQCMQAMGELTTVLFG